MKTLASSGTDGGVFERLVRLGTVRDDLKALGGAIGASVSFMPSVGLAVEWRAMERNPFCKLVHGSRNGRELCREARAMALRRAHEYGSATITACPFGLAELVMPVRTGGGAVGSILAGGVLLEQPDISRLGKLLEGGPEPAECARLRDAYRRTRVVTGEEYRSFQRMMELVARELGAVAGRLAGAGDSLRNDAWRAVSPPPEPRINRLVGRCEAIIAERFRDDLSLAQVAREVGASASHLSRQFKAITGFSFTRYLCKTRVDELKRLLLVSESSVTTAIFESGFQSISQANRVFRSAVGMSPGEFRARSR